MWRLRVCGANAGRFEASGGAKMKLDEPRNWLIAFEVDAEGRVTFSEGILFFSHPNLKEKLNFTSIDFIAHWEWKEIYIKKGSS